MLNERNGRHGDKDTMILSKTRNCQGCVSLCKSKKKKTHISSNFTGIFLIKVGVTYLLALPGLQKTKEVKL